MHITDGESQDGNPIPYADALKSLATDDGNVLLFNCHLSMTAADPFMFPATDEGLPDELAKVLFHMSSVLPEPFYRPRRDGRLPFAARRPRHGLQCRHGLFDPISQHGYPGGAGLALGR